MLCTNLDIVARNKHTHTHTHPLSPSLSFSLYQLILSRRSEVLSVECEMSAVHGLLSKLPDSLNYEQLIRVAAVLFERHPPKQVAKRGRLKMSNRSVCVCLSGVVLTMICTICQHLNYIRFFES